MHFNHLNERSHISKFSFSIRFRFHRSENVPPMSTQNVEAHEQKKLKEKIMRIRKHKNGFKNEP